MKYSKFKEALQLAIALANWRLLCEQRHQPSPGVVAEQKDFHTRVVLGFARGVS